MKTSIARIAALAFAAAIAASPAFAKDKEDKHAEKAWEKHEKRAEKGWERDKKAAEKQGEREKKHAEKSREHAKKEAESRREHDLRYGEYFDDRHREHARRYYHEHYVGAGRCPPGLAKRGNGCMPPGQARKWAVGQPVPRDVVVYEVPRPVLMQLPPAPVGYRYERLGGDIVLVRVNGRIVIDILGLL